MTFYAIMPEHKTWVRCAVILMGGYVIYHGATSVQWYDIPIGILIVLCALFFKQYIVSDKGIDVRTNLAGIVSHSLWKWEEITILRTDYHAAKPNVQIHFTKDIATRMMVFTKKDAQKILEMAAEQNPDIYIDDMNAEKEAELAYKARKHVEQLEAQQAAKKAARAEKKKKRRNR